MKRWIRYVVLAGLVTFVVLVARKGYPDYVAAREAADREKTMRWLWSVIVPKVDFHDTSLKEVVAFMNRKIADIPGHPEGLHIEFASAEETATVFRPVKSDTPPTPVELAFEESDGPKITFELTDIPLGVVLTAISDLSGRVAETRGRVIRFHNVHDIRGTCDPIVTKTFHVEAFFERVLTHAEIHTEVEPAGDVMDVSKFMSANGITIHEGDSFELYCPSS